MTGFSIVVVMVAMAQAAAVADDQLTRLTASEIRSSLAGHLVRYERPGWVDMAVHEEFREDGQWRGIRYSRGPNAFSGLWKVDGDRLCVAAMEGLTGVHWAHGWVCRDVWRDARSGNILMNNLVMLEGLEIVHVEIAKPPF